MTGFLFVLVLGIAAALLGGMTINKMVQNHNRDLAVQVNQNMNMFFKNITELTMLIGSQLKLDICNKYRARILVTLPKHYSYTFGDIYLLDRRGLVIMKTNREFHSRKIEKVTVFNKPVNLELHNSVRQAIETNTVTTSPPFFHSYAASACMFITSPLTDDNGKVNGAIATEIDLRHLWERLDLMSRDDACIHILDKAGIVIAGTEHRLLGKKWDFAAGGGKEEFLQAGFAYSRNSRDYYATLSYAGLPGGWKILVEHDLKSTKTLYNNIAVLTIGFTLTGAAFLFIVLSSLIGKELKPISSLSETASQIALSGDLAEELYVQPKTEKTGSMEINLLMRSFYNMLYSLQSVQTRLNNVNQSLVQEIEEKNRIESALRESEEQLRLLFESSPEPILSLAPDRTIIACNRAFLDELGFSSEEVIGHSTIVFHRSEDSYLDFGLKVYPIVRKFGYWRGEWEFKRKNGTPFLTETVLARKNSPDGSDMGYVAILNDITKRKQAEEELKAGIAEKEVLISEIHHRVKNNMQIIISLLNLQAARENNEVIVRAFRESQNRILSMSLVHEALHKSDSLSEIDLGQYITSLADALNNSYSVGHFQPMVKVDIQGKINVGIDQAVPCGLVLNELITNAIKYAYPEGEAGFIEVAASLHKGDIIEMTVKDRGIGITDDYNPADARTLGLSLVRSLVERQLSGRLELIREQGTTFKVVFKR